MGFNVVRWFVSLIGVQLLCGIVWVLGPLLPQFEDWVPRVAVIGAAAVLWIVVNLLLDVRRLSRERALAQGVTGGAAEASAIREKLARAMALLRKTKGRRFLYEQPWYAIIGPPGAGKTTALLNAGLHFPLAEEMGRGAVAGVGGTRQCDWWFTEEAVLIDTAGRYTTQDSDAEVDRQGWDTFLGLLRATRPRQPLNGVLVAIALNDVTADNAAERHAHARAIRRRVAELEARLGVRVPVYALFTKADLLAGFTEFFDDMDRGAREQVWGVTFPFRKAAPKTEAAVDGIKADLRSLVERLDRRMFDRLDGEASAERRAAVSAFPAQFASTAKPVAEFLEEAFGTGAGGAVPMLRGVYFASATQEGLPIDRLTGSISRAFGLEQRRAARLRPEDGRTYFLTGLLRDVVFREAMLVSERPGAARRRIALRVAGFAACLLLAAAGAGAVWFERQAGQAGIEAGAATLASFEAAAGALPLDPVQDADLPRLLPWLDQARAAAGRPLDAGRNWLGLGQDAKLEAGTRALYRHALDFALHPRLMWRLEAMIRGNLAQPDFTFEATRIYLMLGGAGPLDRDLVREWMALDWDVTYPGEANAPLRAGLLRHLDALLAEPLPRIEPDGDLVAAARATFGRVSLAQRIYSRIKPSGAAVRLPPWRPSDVLGAAGVKVFIRASGRPLDQGIPGFFTLDGFYKVLLPGLPGAVQQVLAESWVLGQKPGADSDAAAMRAAERDVIALYTADYILAWDGMLADLEIAPLRSLTQAAQDLYVLSAPQSPMRALLASVSTQLGLAAAAGAQPGQPDETRGRMAAAAGRPAAAEPQAWPGQDVDDHFKGLRTLLGTGTGAPIDQVMKPLVDLQQQINKMVSSANRAGAVPDPGNADPAVALRIEAQRQEQPVRRWFTSIAASGLALRGGGAKQQLTAAFNAGGGPSALCPVVVNGKYPFTPGATNEATPEEFGKLFAPGGVLDAFFNTQLKPYVDTTSRPWKLQQVEGMAAPFSPADLGQFQRAAAIRDAFFSAGSTVPQVRFDITPTTKDAGGSVSLDLGSVQVLNAGGPPKPAQVTWAPATKPPPTVKLGWENGPTLQDSGPWGLLRLFARARTQPGGADRATLLFQSGERQAGFELRAAGNPFASPVLQEFRCPAIQ